MSSLKQQLKKKVKIPTSVAKTEFPEDEKIKQFQCKGCGEVQDKLGPLIRCRNDHIFCTECSENYKDSIMNNLTKQTFPLECPIKCGSHISIKLFERFLKEKQQQEYVRAMTLQTQVDNSDDDGIMVNCLHCDFCAYYDIEPEIFYCQNAECRKAYCVACKQDVPVFSDFNQFESQYTENGEDNEDEDPSDQYMNIICEHSQHYSDYKQIKEIEKLIEKGSCQVCPFCKTKGQKDDACTHMTCECCDQVWCYCCGLKVEDCYKGKKGKSIYDHNEKWSVDKRYCPMFLMQIKEIDDRWPNSDQECLNFFHSLKTIQYLQEWVDENGEERWNELCDKYDRVKNCGYSLDNIMNKEVAMIISDELSVIREESD